MSYNKATKANFTLSYTYYWINKCLTSDAKSLEIKHIFIFYLVD